MRIYETVESRELIERGWSGDRKYRAVTAAGEIYLLRISPPEQRKRKEREFARMQQVAALGISMCLPVECGTCPEGFYSLQSWIDGTDANDVIGSLDPRRQYAYGLYAGTMLERIHQLPAPDHVPDWERRFNQKIDRKIRMYQDCPLKYDRGDLFLGYLAANRHLLQGRPQSYQHGDYHVGNMMIDRNGKLVIIDFDRDDYGDPWEEFNRIVWCAQTAPAFASGMVDGYFGGEIPLEFWKLLALYICSNTLSSLPWAVPYGAEQIQIMTNQADMILQWYDGMDRVIPTWYQCR